jgi:hypothetical protein
MPPSSPSYLRARAGLALDQQATPPNGGASAVSLLLAHLGGGAAMGPASWCVLAAVSQEWRLCCSDGALWALGVGLTLSTNPNPNRSE